MFSEQELASSFPYMSAGKLRVIFAENVARFRKMRGLTQEDLAERADFAIGTIRGYEQCINWPEPERIEAIAKVLQVEPAQLMRDPGSKTHEIALPALIHVHESVSGLLLSLGEAGLLPDGKKAKRATGSV